MKNSGITLIALAITVAVLLILLSVTVTLGIRSMGETTEDKLKAELSMVQNAVLQQYYKYTVTKKEQDIVGTLVPDAEIQSIASQRNITLTTIEGAGGEYSYYRLTPTELKTIGIKNSKDTYIVNYGTGEVINETVKETQTGYKLYIQAISEQKF